MNAAAAVHPAPGALGAWRGRVARLTGWPLSAATVAALTAAAALLHTRALGAGLWIDEGISVGIASHSIGSIPHVLLQDGSPPLYYLILHVWISAFGRTPTDLHALSVLFGVLAVPAAWWAASVFGRGAGAAAAAFIALSPFVGLYADEVRMYSMLVLVSLLATGAFLRAFAFGRRRHVATFAVALAAVMYTHNWGEFLAAALGLTYLVLLAVAPDRRRMLVDGLIGFGAALVLFAPWLPSVVDQAAHTGAPWSHRPNVRSLQRAVTRMFNGTAAETALLLVALGGFIELVRRGGPAQRRAVLATLGVAAGTLLIAYAWSRWTSPAWALRYLAVVIAPLAIVVGAGLGRMGVLGAVTMAVVAVLLWSGHPSSRTLDHKSNVSHIASVMRSELPRGTVVFSTQPEQVSNLAYYLPPGLRYVTPLGPVRDPGVMDWRDAMRRLRAARFGSSVAPVLRALRPGQRLLLVQPQFSHPDSPWTKRIHHIARSWGPLLRRRLVVLRTVVPKRGYSRSTVDAILLERASGHGRRVRGLSVGA